MYKRQTLDLFENYQDYLALQHLYQAALKQLQMKFEVLNDEFQIRTGRSPIHHIETRLKSTASILAKLQKRGCEVTLDSAKQNINDLAGVRVVCPFINDVYLLVQELRQQSDFEVFKEKDYILHPKENGYRSYHLIIQVNLQQQQVPVEIQLRTIAMDCWASLEHQLRYKKHLPESAALSAELKRCADEMASTDLSMQAIQEILDLRSGACMVASLPDKEVLYATLNR